MKLLEAIIFKHTKYTDHPLKPLTGDVGTIDLLVKMQCSSEEILGPGIHVDTTCHAPPFQITLWTSHPPPQQWRTPKAAQERIEGRDNG